ncbi:hypothetical protein OAG76_03620 [Rubripirellula sp.]|nr:hypothetical protein [Rubripirellula sp.]
MPQQQPEPMMGDQNASAYPSIKIQDASKALLLLLHPQNWL